MSFRNVFEEECYKIAQEIWGSGVEVKHNFVIEIENVNAPETITFSGPPKKEIDLITITSNISTPITILISCKAFSDSKAQPTHIQEWASVLDTMNKYSEGTKYLGIVISQTVFTSGCEAWATSHNMGLIPPIKGTPALVFSKEIILQMLKRVLIATKKIINIAPISLFEVPEFYNFIYSIIADFEGYGEALIEGKRFSNGEDKRNSSFSELVENILYHKILEINLTESEIIIFLENKKKIKLLVEHVNFQDYEEVVAVKDEISLYNFTKNLSFDTSSFEEIKKYIIKKEIINAGDMGTHFELGIEDDILVQFFPYHLNIIRTLNPIQEHLL